MSAPRLESSRGESFLKMCSITIQSSTLRSQTGCYLSQVEHRLSPSLYLLLCFCPSLVFVMTSRKNFWVWVKEVTKQNRNPSSPPATSLSIAERFMDH